MQPRDFALCARRWIRSPGLHSDLGDDQYENFRENGVAPFCVFALDGIDARPYKRIGAANTWASRFMQSSTAGGPSHGDRQLLTSLVEQRFDIKSTPT